VRQPGRKIAQGINPVRFCFYRVLFAVSHRCSPKRRIHYPTKAHKGIVAVGLPLDTRGGSGNQSELKNGVVANPDGDFLR
jgi:hypothetical protein